jgi:Xaa-Pro aminopeptidase
VPIVVDVFPRDMVSGCWGDITRTFCIGEPPEELVEWHAAVREAQQQATAAVRAGIGAGELNAIACDVLEAKGYRTRRTHADGGVLEEGFVHYLGHGLGLELHEAPTLDEGGETLVAGDVITIEPGLYRRGLRRLSNRRRGDRDRAWLRARHPLRLRARHLELASATAPARNAGARVAPAARV